MHARIRGGVHNKKKGARLGDAFSLRHLTCGVDDGCGFFFVCFDDGGCLPAASLPVCATADGFLL